MAVGEETEAEPEQWMHTEVGGRVGMSLSRRDGVDRVSKRLGGVKPAIREAVRKPLVSHERAISCMYRH